jgi:hypothetical protein
VSHLGGRRTREMNSMRVRSLSASDFAHFAGDRRVATSSTTWRWRSVQRGCRAAVSAIGHLVNRDIVTIEASSSRVRNGLLAMFSDSGSSDLKRLAKGARRKFGRSRAALQRAALTNCANLNRGKRRCRSGSVPHGGVQ